MTDKEIIKGILNCTVNVNDVNKHISVDGYNLMTIFKLLYKASCEYIYSKTKQRSIYKLSNRWFEYEDGGTVWLQDDKTFIDETYTNILHCMRLIVDKIESTPEPQQEQEETQSTKPQQELIDILPEQLKTDEAVKIFQQAIDAKLIEKTNEGLKWKERKQLLAYFATKLSDRFNLSTKLDKDGNKTTAWKPFEELFNEKEGTLKVAKQNWMRLNLDFEPTGFEKVKALF